MMKYFDCTRSGPRSPFDSNVVYQFEIMEYVSILYPFFQLPYCIVCMICKVFYSMTFLLPSCLVVCFCSFSFLYVGWLV